MNVVLIGYRGTGKTAIGKLLAQKLDMTYVELDAEIVNRAGKSIPDIVEEEGWAHFREMEANVVGDVSTRDNCVLDTGGGAILRKDNVEHLRRNGIVFWLQTAIADIASRIGSDDQRPSLTGTKSFTEEIQEVLAERTPEYAAAAHEAVDTSKLSIEEAADLIAQRVREA